MQIARSIFRAPKINNPSVAKQMVEGVNADTMHSFIVKLVGRFNNRYAETNQGVQTSNWIMKEWENIIGVYRLGEDVKIETFSHTISDQKSIIATIQGTKDPMEIVIIGAHLDSTSRAISKWLESSLAPGADDNASGITVLTEALRVMMKLGYKPEKTIKIMAFANEEIGLVGSRDIARQYDQDGKDVIAMLNFDMVGYKGEGSKGIYLSEDFSNVDLAEFLMKILDTYLPRVTKSFMKCDYGCSDHAAWTNQGYPAIMATEKFPPGNPNYHTDWDTVVNELYMSNYARLAVIFLAEVAKGKL